MDARDHYLALYDHTHFQGKAEWTLAEPMVAHYRTVLPGHNSVAWLLWHIARGEDWTIQTILQGREQLLTRDGWGARMGVAYPGFGGGMDRAEMIALSEANATDLSSGPPGHRAAGEQDVEYVEFSPPAAHDEFLTVARRNTTATKTS